MTKYYSVPLSRHELEEIALGIKSGKNVIFPTETVYGIGADATNDMAVKGIFEAKGRPNDKPLIVLIDDMAKLDDIIERPNDLEKKLMEAFWPGALTIIFNLKSDSRISKYVSCGSDTIGIRLTSSGLARDLIRVSGVPMVAPSANMSGEKTGINIEEIKNTFRDKVDYVIDGGNIESDTTSTLVRVVDGEIKILRSGKISSKEILGLKRG